MTLPHGIAILEPTVAALVEEGQQAERSGQRDVARQRYEEALHRLRGEPSGVASSIIRRIARAYVDDGQFEAALDCLAAAQAISEANGETSGIAHAVNLMAITQVLRGDLDDAQRLYGEALAFAVEAGDEPLHAMIEQNLGIIASMRGDLTRALDHYALSLVTYRAAGLRQHLGPVLNNMGLDYTRLGRLDEAQAAYDEAVVHCDAAGDAPHRLLALINSTSLWIARGDVNRAATLCETVLSEANSAGDQRALAETFKHMGVIARIRGQHDEARHHLDVAYKQATQREDHLLAAETAREQAELFELMGLNRETLQALSLSHRLFTKLKAERNLADLQQRLSRLESRFFDIVARWAYTIESKDAYTRGHCERVADYACMLARDVGDVGGFDEITLFWFRVGAILHDVGKVDVPSEILNKPGRLTDEERAIMERHAPAGSDLLKDIDFPWDILPMVRGHHERWDGSGYPDKIAGENIALSARITCIADVYDALTTDRPYRRGFTRDDALTMMARDVGKMFDPELFPRFERLIRGTQEYAIPEGVSFAFAS